VAVLIAIMRGFGRGDLASKVVIHLPTKERLVSNLEFHPPTSDKGRRGFVTRTIDGYALGDFEARECGDDQHECSWQHTKDGQLYAITEQAEEGSCLLANGFLTNWVPYNTSNPLLPLDFIAKHVRYTRDKDLFGVPDLWQTSAQVYTRAQGDCEDHAVLLTDWLSGLGHDARVVCGSVQWSGSPGSHCWVALFRDGKQYLLEATTKRPERLPPLVPLMTEYAADYMFNKDSFWSRTGEPGKRDYSDQYWRKTSAFSSYTDTCQQRVFQSVANLALGKSQEALKLLNGTNASERPDSDERKCAIPELELALVLRESGRRNEALTHFQRVPEERRTVHFMVELAETYIQEERYREALEWSRKAEALQPNLSDVIFKIAWSLEELGQLDESERYYLKHIQRWPARASAYNNLGVVYQRMNKLARAKQYFKKATELSPETATYRKNLHMIEGRLKG